MNSQDLYVRKLIPNRSEKKRYEELEEIAQKYYDAGLKYLTVTVYDLNLDFAMEVVEEIGWVHCKIETVPNVTIVYFRNREKA